MYRCCCVCVVGAVHVAAADMSRDDAGYVEALEHETDVLEKRVMLVTVFDVTTT